MPAKKSTRKSAKKAAKKKTTSKKTGAKKAKAGASAKKKSAAKKSKKPSAAKKTKVAKKAKAVKKAKASKKTKKTKKTKVAKKAKTTKKTKVAKKAKAAAKTKAAKKTTPAKKTKTARKAKAAKDTSTVVSPPGAAAEPVEEKPKPKITRKLTARQLEKIRLQLREKQQQISRHMQTELSELEVPDKGRSGDLDDLATDADAADSLCEIMDIEASQIDQIATALKKIEDGTYGICEDCGHEISLPRLEALPFASQCIECKRKSELTGASSYYPSFR